MSQEVQTGSSSQEGRKGEVYTGQAISMYELIWGEGWLSPGGPDEVDRLVEGIELKDRPLLDIGCGTGGIDMYLADKHRAGPITAVDIEAGVLDVARNRARARGLEGRIEFVQVAPGPLPFEEGRFAIVFSKDALIHVADKHAILKQAFRVLKPGGRLVVSDWLIGHDETPSELMRHYVESGGLGFNMASATVYRDALMKAGFSGLRLTSRNQWYRAMARKELMAMSGEIREEAEARFGKDYVATKIARWQMLVELLDSGEHAPTHIFAVKPG